MEIREKNITQIVLVKFDEIPLEKMAVNKNLRHISEELQFARAQAVNVPVGDKGLVFENGVFEKDESQCAILRLIIEERKIQLYMEGSSDISLEVFEKLRGLMADIKGVSKRGFLDPIVVSFESTITAKMSFNYEALISQPLALLARTALVEATESELAATRTRLSNLAFEIEYSPSSEELAEYRISLSRKRFVLEPRTGFPAEEQIFLSEAPLDTNKHIGILEQIEKSLTNGE